MLSVSSDLNRVATYVLANYLTKFDVLRTYNTEIN